MLLISYQYGNLWTYLKMRYFKFLDIYILFEKYIERKKRYQVLFLCPRPSKSSLNVFHSAMLNVSDDRLIFFSTRLSSPLFFWIITTITIMTMNNKKIIIITVLGTIISMGTIVLMKYWWRCWSHFDGSGLLELRKRLIEISMTSEQKPRLFVLILNHIQKTD